MFKLRFTILLLLQFVGHCYLAQRYSWKYNTIAHRLLEIEETTGSISIEGEKAVLFDSEHKVIDMYIDTAIYYIRPIIANIQDRNSKVKKIFEELDSSLFRNNIIICVTIDLLSQGLMPKLQSEYSCVIETWRYKLEENRKYYGVDCDLSAFLYLSVGEVLNLPIKYVEVPGHSFVRWRFNDSVHMNWDTNDAQIISDDAYRSKGNLHNPLYEKNCHYLQDNTEEEIKGYYITLVGLMYKRKKEYAIAENCYKNGLTLKPFSAITLNNLAWMYLTVSDFNKPTYYKEAFTMSQKIQEMMPSNKEYLEVHACACAAVNKRTEALQSWKDSYTNSDTKSKYLPLFEKGKTCLKMGLK